MSKFNHAPSNSSLSERAMRRVAVAGMAAWVIALSACEGGVSSRPQDGDGVMAVPTIAEQTLGQYEQLDV